MIYVFLANGFEEVEALAPVDILRRAGLHVQTVGIDGKQVVGAHQISVLADIDASALSLASDVEAIVLPGGMPGASNLNASAVVQSAIDFAVKEDKLLCAICAAPFILGDKGLLQGKRAVCYPGYESHLHGAALCENFVCRDGNVITAKGMGVATEFGLAIVAALCGDEMAADIRASVQCR